MQKCKCGICSLRQNPHRSRQFFPFPEKPCYTQDIKHAPGWQNMPGARKQEDIV